MPLTVLNVAEKPSVCRALTQVFAQSQGARQGQFNGRNNNAAQVYQIDGVRFPSLSRQGDGRMCGNNVQQEEHTMIMTSVRGHLAGQEFAGNYRCVGFFCVSIFETYTFKIPERNEYPIKMIDSGYLFTACIDCTLLIHSTQILLYNKPNNIIYYLILSNIIHYTRNIRSWSGCAPISLFDAPIETIYREDMQPLERMLRTISTQADALILWLDCDREGEHIAHEVREVCQRGNPRLQRMNRVYRAKFSTVLPNEIQRALKSLGRINEGMVDAVEARMQLDLRVGAAFTRFQSLRLQQRFDQFNGGNKKVISYGPCQFPTLGFVVERWARIETFVPENFWTIEMSITVPDDTSNTIPNSNSNVSRAGRTLKMTWKRGRLYDRTLALSLYAQCLEYGLATVVEVQGRAKNKWRPLPLATVELQKRCAKYLRIGSESFMQSAEALYNDGYISYPRTETEVFRPEFDHQALIETLAAIEGPTGRYANALLHEPQKFQTPRAGNNDDQAHPPITPCRAVVNPDATITDPKQRGIYKLVVQHYLACCSRDAQGSETEITCRMGSELFHAKGLMITELNWLEIYKPWERWGTGQGLLPTVEVGSEFTPSHLLVRDGRTAPPALLSEVELIGLMDKNGIGTDATIAQHISTIQERSYAEKDAGQKFHPTKLGIALVEGYNRYSVYGFGMLFFYFFFMFVLFFNFSIIVFF